MTSCTEAMLDAVDTRMYFRGVNDTSCVNSTSSVVDVTEWGNAGLNPVVKIHHREAIEASLLEVFDASLRLKAAIVWKDGLPTRSLVSLRMLSSFCSRMKEAWGEIPPYIEVVSVGHDPANWYSMIYSIKPVWEEQP